VQVSSPGDRLLQVQMSNLQVDHLAQNRLYRFKGLFELQEIEREGQVLLIIQAFGYNAEGEPIGVNALQFKLDAADFPHTFELSLFSLSGEIDEYDQLLEAQPLLEAE